jgi:uncharacterized protein YukE
VSHTHLRLGDQARAAQLLEARMAALTDVLRTLEVAVQTHGAGFDGAGATGFRNALRQWLDAAHRVPTSIGAFGGRLLGTEATMQRAQDEQAAIFERVARSLGGPA